MNQKSQGTKPTEASIETGNKGGIVDQAKQTAANVASQAKQGVTQQVSQQIDVRKEKAVETISNVADAIRGAGDKLEDAGPLPQLAERAADGIEQLAHYFEGKNAADLFRMVERTARREPALFLGATFALGLVAGRFLKSSARRPQAMSGGGGVDTEGRYAYGADYGYGYESEYAGEGYLDEDDFAEDEPFAFQPEDRGVTQAAGYGAGASGGVGSLGAEEPFRTTQPQGSSAGSVGYGGQSGATEKMPATPGLSGSSSGGSTAIGGGVNVGTTPSTSPSANVPSVTGQTADLPSTTPRRP